MSVVVQIVQYVPPYMEIERVFGRLIEEVCGLDQFWPQGVEGDLGDPEVPVVSLR